MLLFDSWCQRYGISSLAAASWVNERRRLLPWALIRLGEECKQAGELSVEGVRVLGQTSIKEGRRVASSHGG